jgi:hypothetical protein
MSYASIGGAGREVSNPSIFWNRTGLFIAVLSICLTLAPGRSGAQSLLLGPEPPPRQLVPLDPRLPTGALRWSPQPGVEAMWRACSARVPVCVAGSRSQSAGSFSPEALRALERAWDLLIVGARLPRPALVPGSEGSELTWRLEDSARFTQAESTPPMTAGFITPTVPLLSTQRGDRAWAHCIGLPAQSLERTALQCVAESSLAAVAPAVSSHLRRAWSTRLASVVLGPTSEPEGGAAPPSQAIVGSQLLPNSGAAQVLFEFLETYLAGKYSDDVSTALLTREPTSTAPGAARWNGEPDLLDVLRSTLSTERTPQGYAEMWSSFALWRRTPTAPGASWQQQTWEALRPPPDLILPLDTLPRRVLTPRVLEPSGEVGIWIPFNEVAPRPRSLGMRMTCESPASYSWGLARTDRSGHQLGRIPIAFEPGQPEVERSVTLQPEDGGLLLVGTNLGGVDSRHPFDPDVAPYEPHACVIYVTVLEPG